MSGSLSGRECHISEDLGRRLTRLAVALEHDGAPDLHSIDALAELLTVLRHRLLKFSNIPHKHIIYGGDIGGELARQLMCGIYGELAFTVFAMDLPCYPDELREFIKKQVGTALNTVWVRGASECHAAIERGQVARGECSKIVSYVYDQRATPTLEVCGCFYASHALERFIRWNRPLVIKDRHNEFNAFWSLRVADGIERYYLYLFAEIPQIVCELLAFLLADQYAHDWWHWRVHVCRTNNGYVDVWSDAEQRKWRLAREHLLGRFRAAVGDGHRRE